VYSDKENIVAVATTPSSESALNIVRCSGKTVFSVYKKITQQTKNPKANSAFFRSLYDENKKLIDRAVVLSFKGPKSFSGEDVIEFSIHGGESTLNSVLSALVAFGCRIAEPGEFTYRAFLNGKLDLVQAESINALIKSKNSNEASLALNNVKGALSEIITLSTDRLMSLIVSMEHELDFNDDEICFTSKKEYINQIKKIYSSVDAILSSSFLLSSDERELRVCFAGKTNAGKSSIFNLLVGKKRAIVSNKAGTTRDVVSEGLNIGESFVQLVDTAGLRLTKNKIENEGIIKTNTEIKKSDVLVFVDTKNPIKEFKRLKIKHKNVVFVLNKQDKQNKQENSSFISTSCVSGFGIKNLKQTLQLLVKKLNLEGLENKRYLLNLRQKKELSLFLKELKKAEEAFSSSEDLVVALTFLYNARSSIKSILNPIDKNDILNNIFGGFCVGK